MRLCPLLDSNQRSNFVRFNPINSMPESTVETACSYCRAAGCGRRNPDLFQKKKKQTSRSSQLVQFHRQIHPMLQPYTPSRGGDPALAAPAHSQSLAALPENLSKKKKSEIPSSRLAEEKPTRRTATGRNPRGATRKETAKLETRPPPPPRAREETHRLCSKAMNGRLFGFISSHPPQQQQTAAAAAESDQSRERESVCVRTEGRKKCGGLEEDHAQSKLIRDRAGTNTSRGFRLCVA